MKITVFRSAEEIGGNCIKLSTRNTSILLDIGAALDGSPFKANDVSDINYCIISHPHMDHYGEIESLSTKTTVFSGEESKKLIDITRMFTKKTALTNPWKYFYNQVPFQLGDFRITPFLLDHSAFDSYGFLIEADGLKLFYTGDFRFHGRKSNLDITKIPKNLDLLICEGTMLTRQILTNDKEADVEKWIVDLLKDSSKPAFINMSSQNVDRVISVYRAALQTNRIFVIDIYTAYVLSKIYSTFIPKAGWNNIKVFYPFYLSKYIADYLNKNILYDFKKYRISKTELNSIIGKVIMLVRNSMQFDLENRLMNIDGSHFINSLWKGYWDKPGNRFRKFIESKNMDIQHIHVSGHAYTDDLENFIKTINPKAILPVHTENPGGFGRKIIKVKDGEEFEL